MKSLLDGTLPVYVGVGEQAYLIATTHVDSEALFRALRLRLLMDEDLSGRPLWLAVNSMPGVGAHMTDAEYAKALDQVIEFVVFTASIGVRAGLFLNGVGQMAVTPDALVASALKATLQNLRFCKQCGKPFRFSRRLKTTCGSAECRPVPTRRVRPGHAERVGETRWKRAKDKAMAPYRDALARARTKPPTAETIQRIFDRYASGDLEMERHLDTLAELSPTFEQIMRRLSRYRVNRSRRGRMKR